MKKILLVPIFLFFISSCTLPWSKDSIPSEHNFQNDYSRHVKAIFDTVDKNLELAEIIAKYMSPSGFDDSTIRISGIIPQIGSGELSVHANAVRETHLLSNLGAELDIRGFIASLDEMIQMNIKGGFINSLDSYYFHLDQAELSGSGSQYEKINSGWNQFTQKFTPYFGKWIQVSLIDIANFGNKNSNSTVTPLKLISAIQLDILSGGKKIRKILSAHPMLRSLESLGKKNDLYGYRVELDNTGALAFAENFMMEYSGTGMSQDDREKLLDGLGKITLSGVLSIHAEQSKYMSFSGVLTSSGEKSPLEFDIAFLPDDVHMVISSEGKEDLFFRAKDHGDTSEYMLSASGKIIAKGTIQGKSDSIEGIDFFLIAPKEEGLHMMYANKNKKDFTLKIDKVTQSDNTILLSLVDLVGTIQNQKLTLLSGSISSNETLRSMQFSYISNTDGSFQGKLHSKELPGDIMLDGHINDDDILLNLSTMGIISTLTHKNNKDKTFEGSLKLPVVTIKWGGKTTKEFYDSFFINASSPLISASLNMKTVDGWLAGPLNISSPTESADIPSIDIRAKRHDKDFSLQTDIGMGSGSTEKAHFEWDSHIDVRWDKNAKVKIPTELIPFSNVYSIFSGSESINSSNEGNVSIPNYSDL